jgi:hypothetical protein
LDAFHLGYSAFAGITRAKLFDVRPLLRESVLKRYGLGENTLGVFQLISQIASDDQAAFDLFFTELDVASLSHSEFPEVRGSRSDTFTLEPASSFLGAFSSRPSMYLTPVTVGGLRAALDGYSLAAVEEGHSECADLDGFERWVRDQFMLKGLFRWENAILTQFLGDQNEAFQWAVKELKAYHASRRGLDMREGRDSRTDGT